MKFVLAAGGTGGHFYPALALAKELIKRNHSVEFIVRRHDFVVPLLEREGLAYTSIFAAGWRRAWHPINLLVPFKLIAGTIQALLCLKKAAPKAVVVMGGYVSVPPALAAASLGLPILLHEQNVLPGLANRLLARLAKKIALSFPIEKPLFQHKSVFTGNPLRSDLMQRSSKAEALREFNLDANKRTVLVFGGSLGAKKINNLIIEIFRSQPALGSTFQVFHIAGTAQENEVRSAYEQCGLKHYVCGYYHDMGKAYSTADLVICRAGASTVSELMALKIPAFLIPYPFATADHQMKNAELISNLGAGFVEREGPHLKESLLRVLMLIKENPEILEQYRMAYNKGPSDLFQSTEKLANLATSLI